MSRLLCVVTGCDTAAMRSGTWSTRSCMQYNVSTVVAVFACGHVVSAAQVFCYFHQTCTVWDVCSACWNLCSQGFAALLLCCTTSAASEVSFLMDRHSNLQTERLCNTQHSNRAGAMFSAVKFWCTPGNSVAHCHTAGWWPFTVAEKLLSCCCGYSSRN